MGWGSSALLGPPLEALPVLSFAALAGRRLASGPLWGAQASRRAGRAHPTQAHLKTTLSG